MKNILFLLVILSVVVSCELASSNAKNASNNTSIFPLDAESIFNGQDVLIHFHSDKDSTQVANKLFLDGLDAYRNNNNPEEAIELFTSSIIKHPSPKAYYELGNAYIDMKMYDQSIEAYSMAEQLGYEPFSKLLYNMACAYSLAQNNTEAGKYLEYAIKAGYVNLEHIESDPDLDYLRSSSYLYKSHLENAILGMSDANNLFFLHFKKRFPKVKTPLNIETRLPSAYFEENGYITYDYEQFISEMRDEKFSREVSKGFFYYAALHTTGDFSALIYIMRDEFMGDESPLLFRLATFTEDGKIIDKKEIAGQEAFAATIKKTRIERDTIFTYTCQENYEKDPFKHGYNDNPVVSVDTLDFQKSYINSLGKIITLAPKEDTLQVVELEEASLIQEAVQQDVQENDF